MLDILERICQGEGRPEDIDLLQEMGEQIKAGSLCQLGQTAPNPVLTTLRYFRDEYEAHINEKHQPDFVLYSSGQVPGLRYMPAQLPGRMHRR